MTVVVESREDFTLAAFRRVTVGGEDVVVGPAALGIMGAARAGFEELLHSGPEGFIYGVTTRPGVEVGTTIPPGEWRSYARRFRGVGRGFGRDRLDERVARGIVFAHWPTSSAVTPKCVRNSPSTWPLCWQRRCHPYR